MKAISKILVLVLALGVSSCATKGQTGALIGGAGGAAAGAGIGAAIGGGEGALIGAAAGAVVGAMTGAAVGTYMDRQEEALRKKNLSAKIERVGDQLIVKFDSGILFDVGKASLQTSSEKTLTDFADVLRDFPKTVVLIEGHTDSTGTKGLNRQLSNDRAGSVQGFLMTKSVDKVRMSAVGYADEKPVASNTTEEGRQQNRRVEVKINAIVKN